MTSLSGGPLSAGACPTQDESFASISSVAGFWRDLHSDIQCLQEVGMEKPLSCYQSYSAFDTVSWISRVWFLGFDHDPAKRDSVALAPQLSIVRVIQTIGRNHSTTLLIRGDPAKQEDPLGLES
jgi:hypothetical protein